MPSYTQLGLQELDGDLAMVLEVLCKVDRCHPAAAELALDRVAVGKGESQSGEKIGHGLAGRFGSLSS